LHRHVATQSGQTWKTFLRNHAEGIAAVDFLAAPTIRFERLFAFVVLSHARRRIVLIAVTPNPTAEWIARQILEAFPWDTAPATLLRDNDRAYGHGFKRRLRGMGICDRPTSIRSPWQNGYVERVIGSIRRECLDHVVIRGEAHLRRILLSYADYCNDDRTHLTLSKDTSRRRPVERTGRITMRPMLGGLHHRYARTGF